MDVMKCSFQGVQEISKVRCPKVCKPTVRNRRPTRTEHADDSLDRPIAMRTETTPMKLLVVEDEAKLADYLRKGTSRRKGYVVEVASNGIDGLHMASEGSFDLIVLDTMLPGIDGLACLPRCARANERRSSC